jgi:molybdopterin synthase sulfur carrier subunit
MRLEITAFGIARDILGKTTTEVDVKDAISVLDLKSKLDMDFPELQGLQHYFIAVNEAYADDVTILKPGDTIVIIPPVSGG